MLQSEHAKKNIAFVTGATGFVGSHLVRRLLEGKFETHILTRTTSSQWRISDLKDKVYNHHADLCDKKLLSDVIKDVNPTHIFHLAVAGVYGGAHLPDKNLFEINTFGTLNLIEAANAIDYHAFINTGSSAEYGKKLNPMAEEDVCEPITAYGIAKLASTLYASFVGKTQSRPIITLRLFSPFGPYDDSSRLITYTINQAIRNDCIKLGNPNSVRDFIYISDIIEAYIQSLAKASLYKGEIFNIGSGNEYSAKTVVDAIKQLLSSECATEWNNSGNFRLWESVRWQADIAKAQALLEWKPATTLEHGLAETIQWFKENWALYK